MGNGSHMGDWGYVGIRAVKKRKEKCNIDQALYEIERKRTDAFTEESAGNNEGDIDRVAAHDNLVQTFQNATSASSSSRIHGEFL